jgi:predicted ATPase
LVDTLQASENTTFLLQQPEVHLHPKAQAELGSFLGAIAKLKKNIFVIETHSDYLFDRIKMDIKDKKLSAEDVSVVYFERIGGVVLTRLIELDENGNLINVPDNYRKFFLEEERRMILGE